MKPSLQIILLYLFFVLHSIPLFAQTRYSIDEALKDAEIHAPASLNYNLTETENRIKRKNIGSKMLPQFSLGGQSTYQSETSGLDISVPGFSIPRLSKDQYKVQLDASQMIYDGGTTSIQKKLSDIASELERVQSELEIEQIREQVLQIYFGILEAEMRLEILKTKKDDILSALKKMESAVLNGVVLSSELNHLKAVLLTLSQSESELKSAKKSHIQLLNIYTDQQLDTSTIFYLPEVKVAGEINFNIRPWFKMNQLMQLQLDQSRLFDISMNRPKMWLFAQGGYGKPGLNFLKNEFTPYYIAGIKVQWNLQHMYNLSRDREILAIQKQKTEIKRDAYVKQVELKLTGYQNDMDRLSVLLKQDEEIIMLRQEIKKSTLLQVEKGVKTASEFIHVVSEENEAIMNKKLHHLLWLKTNYLYNHFAGKS